MDAKAPIHLDVCRVAPSLPRLDLLLDGLLSFHAFLKALPRQHAQFNFGHVEPGAMPGCLVRLVPLDALRQTLRFRRREGLIQAPYSVRVEVVPAQRAPASMILSCTRMILSCTSMILSACGCFSSHR